MYSPGATVIVVPREQFSKTERSLESLLACTNPRVPIVYVDGNSPAQIARYLRARAAQRPMTLLRSETYLASNQARNWALRFVRTPYVVFVDNDVSFTPGWLEKLIACAEETGAWAVGPLYLIDDPAKQIVHMAGAELCITRENGAKRLVERHRFSNVPVLRARHELIREQTGLVEFHCMLARMDAFERTGPLDEGLLSFLDHVDFCLDIARTGGRIVIEPAAVVTHLAPPPFALMDLPFFFLRFSDAWLEPSIRRFAAKHGLQLADREFAGHRRFRNGHRLRLLRGIRPLRRIAGWRTVEFIEALFTVFCDLVVENVIAKPLERGRRTFTPPAPPVAPRIPLPHSAQAAAE